MKKKSIYSIIHDNLRRTLVLSLGSTAVVLAVFSYFSLRAVEDNATHFIMKHSEGLAKAGINAQNVSDVDKEITRFAEEWKETQDLDLRIDIFIDNKMIAHAGQLQPFKFLYTSVTKNINLPSGQTLNAQVQIGLKELLIIRGAELLVFELFVLLVYFSLVRSMKNSIAAITRPLELRVAWLKDVASKLPESSKIAPPFDSAKVSEIDDLSQSIEILLNEIVKLEAHIATVNFDRGRVKMAEQVAHNIKGTIATLQLKINSLENLTDSDKHEFDECVNSIRDVSVKILNAKKDEQKSQSVNSVILTKPSLKSLVTSTIELKRKQYQDNSKLQIICDDSKMLDGIVLNSDISELRAVIGNIVDNSVDAIGDGAGIIKLKVNITGRNIEIRVIDNGKGIPDEILPTLMAEGRSYEKPNGTGIGLFHAKETLEKINGEIRITSMVGHGTTVTIIIPRFEDSHKFVKEIKIVKGSTLLIIDDDNLIHAAWEIKLKRSGIPPHDVHYFFTPEDFNVWMSENGHGEFGSRHYFFDYDLKNENFNGLDLIEYHGLSLESLLISGIAGESEIYDRTKNVGVSCLRKDFLADISIVEIDQI